MLCRVVLYAKHNQGRPVCTARFVRRCDFDSAITSSAKRTLLSGMPLARKTSTAMAIDPNAGIARPACVAFIYESDDEWTYPAQPLRPRFL